MIFILFGQSGTGKTTVLQDVIKFKKYNLTPIVTYTTRPPREDEVDGKDYHFIDKDTFLDMSVQGKFLETSKYTVSGGEIWYYGSLKSDFTSDGDKIVIVNPEGLRSILRSCRTNNILTTTIYLYCQETVRLKRLEKRGDSYSEIKRRMEADKKDFKDSVVRLANHKINTSRLTFKQVSTKVGNIITFTQNM